ncbi:hypothetical protein BT96DRAFT_1002151 [Gymnopus androsaceus JB14]|uniref:BTB domain-containing protein n=1 Tax=Gymnopus androsaceus JB14 TaxID=1447944 RepID=A0A6A4H040_9AGAR|nr:hypothetical protein BT96DRAFT_1002151 [Gymnopus androsaceus JB14]
MKSHLLPAHYGSANAVNALFKDKNTGWETIPRFFKNPEEVLLQAENKIFRVNMERFLQLAVGIKGLIELPHAAFDILGTEVEPIYVGVCSQELEIFLDWMHLGPWEQHTFTEGQLVDLFYVGSLFISKQATDWVLHELEQLNLDPARKLGLALKFGICRWVEPSIKELFVRPAYCYTVEERVNMGYQAASILANAQLRVQTERIRRATIPPPINNGFGARECRYYGADHDQSRCAEYWDTLWFIEVGRKLINPVRPLLFAEAVGFVQGLPFEGVTSQCRDIGLDSLNVAFGDIDADILHHVIGKMIDLLPMSAYST